jgi:hypothetical protein
MKLMNKRATRLADYKLYVLDWPGRIAHVVELACEGDENAIRAAAERADGRAMELWLGARMIRRFSAAPARQ